MAATVEEKPAEPEMPAMPSMSMSQMVPLVVSLGLSKVDLAEMGYTRHVEFCYVVIQIAVIAILGFIYTKVTAMDDTGDKIKIPEVKQFGQVVTPATEQTPKEHDNAKLMAQGKQVIMGAVILGGIYYKWQTLFPLVMQLVMTPMQMIESPLFKIYILGKSVPRPFAEPNPFGLPSTPEAPVEDKKDEKKEVKDEDKEDKDKEDSEPKKAEEKKVD